MKINFLVGLLHFLEKCALNAPMTLLEYMTTYKKTETDLAEVLGKHRSVIGRYKSGEVKPPIAIIAKISEITKGKVQFRDWLTQ